MFTVNDARCTNQLETSLDNKQMVTSSKGFTRTSLSATVTRVSNVLLFYIVKATPRPGAFSHSLPNMSDASIAMHVACSKH